MRATSEWFGKRGRPFTGRKRALLSAALVIAAGAASTAASIWISHDTTVIFAPQGADAFSVSVAASPDAGWRPIDSDWQKSPDRRLALSLAADGQRCELSVGSSKTVYVFVRNSSPELMGAFELTVQPPGQDEASDGLFEQLAFKASLESGKTVLDGHGRTSGPLGTLAPGETRRLALSVTLPDGTPDEYLNRTTGVTLRFDAANR